MRRFLLILAMWMAGVCAAVAQYTVEDVTGNVTVRKGATDVTVTKGLALSPMDELTLGKDASVTIFNKSESKSYVWNREGRKSVQSIRIDAGTAAKSVLDRVGNSLQFTRSKDKGPGYVYLESGMVKRSMAEYDPAAHNIEVDARHMAAIIAKSISANMTSPGNLPAQVTNGRNTDGGLFFSVENTQKDPIYFNVIKVGEGNKIEISELGQPSGSYVLRPAQSLAREQFSALGDRHLLVMTHFNFDIDKLIESMDEFLKEETIPEQTSDGEGVYMQWL